MRYATWLRRACWLTAVGIAILAGRSLWADDQAPVAKDAKQATEGKKSQGRVIIPKYRLGAALAPVSSKLDKELKLNGEGLLIERVAPGGPAEKAGIKRDDILLAIGDKPIKKYVDLVEASNALGPKTSMKLLRDGQTVTVTVTLDKHRKNDEKIRVPSNPR